MIHTEQGSHARQLDAMIYQLHQIACWTQSPAVKDRALQAADHLCVLLALTIQEDKTTAPQATEEPRTPRRDPRPIPGTEQNGPKQQTLF